MIFNLSFISNEKMRPFHCFLLTPARKNGNIEFVLQKPTALIGKKHTFFKENSFFWRKQEIFPKEILVYSVKLFIKYGNF
jgi:hypothetical protein